MVVVIYPDALQTNSAHKVEYAIFLSFIYLQGKSTAANILPEQIDSQSYMWSLGGTTICIYAIVRSLRLITSTAPHQLKATVHTNMLYLNNL